MPAVAEVIVGAPGPCVLGSKTHTERAASATAFVLATSAAVCANVKDVLLGTDATTIVKLQEVENACKPHKRTVSPVANP